MTTDGSSGLRERKKLATRQALSWAALRLAVERGMENVRVEDIAAEAGVSPRTFNNYFSSKYEAIVSRHVDRIHQAAIELRGRPAAEPLWDAIVHAVLAPLDDEGATADGPPAVWAAGVRRMISDPVFQGEALKAGAAANNAFAAAVAERTGTDADRDLYPKLVAATVGVAVSVANDQWLRADPPASAVSLVRDALTQLAAGLPNPGEGP